MPSVSDVYHELQAANGRLDTLHADLQLALNRLQVIHNDVTTGFANTVGTLNAGFTAMTEGMQAIIALQTFANEVLLHHTKQNDTMICSLEKISRNTCQLVTESHLQTGLQTAIEKNVSIQTELLKYANAEAALQLERIDALRKQVEECCPPKQKPPACSYEPCETSRFTGEPPRPRPPEFEPVVREPGPIR